MTNFTPNELSDEGALERFLETLDHKGEGEDFLVRQFGLKNNPFPPSGIADASGGNVPLRTDVLERILGFIRNTFFSGQTQFMVVRGDYGTGKTHTLRFIEHLVNERMNKGEGSPRAIYVERPRLEAHELNRAIMRSLGHDTIRKYVWFAIRGKLAEEIQTPSTEFQDLKKKLVGLKIQGRKPKPQAPAIGTLDFETVGGNSFSDNVVGKVFNSENIVDYRTFLTAFEAEGWKRDDVAPFLTYVLLDATAGDRSTELAQAFVALLLARDEQSFTSWETLLAVTGTKSLSSLQAPTFLQFLLHVMALNGIPYVYLLLDEFEEVPQGFLLTPRQRQDYLYTIREVFNKISNGIGFIIAISPAGWDALAKIGTPLHDVVSNIVDLPRIEAEDALKIAHFYMNRARHTPERRTGNLSPFTEESIRVVVNNFPRAVQQTPRNVIQFLHFAVNQVSERQLEEVTPEIAQSMLNEFASMKTSGARPQMNRRPSPDVDRSAT